MQAGNCNIPGGGFAPYKARRLGRLVGRPAVKYHCVSMLPRLSIIIPTRNEAACITDTLRPLQDLRRQDCEIIVVDGGSDDDTITLSQPLADHVFQARHGRARQMNAGACQARGAVLLFLHADTQLPADCLQDIMTGLENSGKGWGRFNVRLSGRHQFLRVVESLMNIRSRLSGIATGDQAMFVRRDWFEQVKGFPDIPLMEDIALSRALKRLGAPLCLRQCVITSSRRWEQHGILRTVVLMWSLRLAYALGVDPCQLASRYYKA